MVVFDGVPATFTTAQARLAGVHFRDLYAARDSGLLMELSRGLFRKSEAPTPTYPDLLAISRRAPRAVVCLLSAAAVHELTDELPEAVQLAVPRGTWAPTITFPPVEVFVWDRAHFELGISQVEAAPGEPVRVYSPTRTVVDLMRLRLRIGEAPAHIALRRYLARPGARVSELMEFSAALGVLGPVRTLVEALIAS